MNVLFVSETRLAAAPYRDASTRHRCYTMAEALHAAGHLADVTTLENLQLVNLSRYDVISVQQPTATRKLLSVLERCKKLNIRTVADVDALEFDPRLAEEAPLNSVEKISTAQIRISFMRKSLALQHFDEVSVATEELARARREQAPSQTVYVVPNALSDFWLSCHEHIAVTPPRTQQVGYFSDHRGMSEEFAVVAPALEKYLKADSTRELQIIGALSIDDDQLLPAAQIKRGAWVDHMDLPASITQCHVCLSPHQHNRLNYAQAQSQFMEAAAFGVPMISSPTAELAEHDVPGLFIAQTDNQWLEHLEALSDDTFYSHCQQSLYNYARKHFLAKNSAQILIRQWSAKHEASSHETTTRLSATS